MQHLFFQDNQIHSNYSDGKFSLEEIFEYNLTHDRLDLTITDHVDRHTDWFPKYVEELKSLRKKYKEFNIVIGCEVKIRDDGSINTTKEILNQAEVVLGSVHHFDGIKAMSRNELLQREYELTKMLVEKKEVDVLSHPFNMAMRFFRADVPRKWVEDIYSRCVKNGILFEYNHRNAPESVKIFVTELLARGEIRHLSFGSDMHDNLREIGHSSYALQPVPTICITGAGTAIAQGILKGLSHTGLRARIITTDMSPLAAGLYAGDASYLMPKYSDKKYIPKIIEICKKEKVAILFVGLDPELELFARNIKKIEKATGAKVVVSGLKAVQIADDKWKTVQFLKENNFPHAKSSLKKDLPAFLKTAEFPLIVKPRIGARSIGLYKVNNKQELDTAIARLKEPIIQEYLSSENDEYTCSGFFYKGKCYGVMCGQRWLRDGDTYKAVFKRDKELEKFIAKVGTKLNLFGPCNFQLRKTKRGPVIFEINSRFSGTTGAMSYLGFNIAAALVHILFLKRPVSSLYFKEAYMFRYWNELFASIEEVETLRKNKYLPNPHSEKNFL
jgi:carbamoyl-phosphate synthase large subunit